MTLFRSAIGLVRRYPAATAVVSVFFLVGSSLAIGTARTWYLAAVDYGHAHAPAGSVEFGTVWVRIVTGAERDCVVVDQTDDWVGLSCPLWEAR
jgi:hypothetical protein